MKTKVSNTTEKNIYVIDRKNAQTSDMLNSNSVFVLRVQDNKPVMNPSNPGISSMSDVPYFNQANSAVSLPAINRQNQQAAKQQSHDKGKEKERQTVQTDDIYMKKPKQEKDTFNRAYKISQLNALTNKRIKQKLENIVLEQGIT